MVLSVFMHCVREITLRTVNKSALAVFYAESGYVSNSVWSCPTRSWPLFRARDRMRRVIESFAPEKRQ